MKWFGKATGTFVAIRCQYTALNSTLLWTHSEKSWWRKPDGPLTSEQWMLHGPSSLHHSARALQQTDSGERKVSKFLITYKKVFYSLLYRTRKKEEFYCHAKQLSLVSSKTFYDGQNKNRGSQRPGRWGAAACGCRPSAGFRAARQQKCEVSIKCWSHGSTVLEKQNSPDTFKIIFILTANVQLT